MFLGLQAEFVNRSLWSGGLIAGRVAKVDSIGLEVRRGGQCRAGKS